MYPLPYSFLYLSNSSSSQAYLKELVVNSLIIKSSAIDSENVSQEDAQSIVQNGEHQLIISEDYFLYNATKRQEALSAIWNKVNGLTYTECTLTSYTGKPFLKKGNKIGVVGYLKIRSYEDKNGSKKYVTEIVAEQIEFLSSKATNNENKKSLSETLKEVEEDEISQPLKKIIRITTIIPNILFDYRNDLIKYLD